VSIHPSGNAAVFKTNGSVWSVTCAEDDITALRSCSVMQQGLQPALLVFKGENGAVFVRVGTDVNRRPYIYTSVELRIDDAHAYTAVEPGWGAEESAWIVRALRAGKSVVTSYIEWPSDNYVDAKFNLAGFDVAMEFVDFAVLQNARNAATPRRNNH
jgi:hypothetical protein